MKKVVYYDGYCGLCHTAVRILLAIDHRGGFCFAPLSNFDKSLKNIDSIVVRLGDKDFYEGNAVIKIFENIEKSNWRYFAYVLNLIPLKILNKIYRWISRNRARFSSKSNLCPIVPSHYKKRFILK